MGPDGGGEVNEEQKALALSLYRNARIKAACRGVRTAEVIFTDADGKQWWAPVPNLADETGEVEGRLHRVLERMVGEPVEVSCPSSVGRWRAWGHGENGRALSGGSHATRIDAIVAALLEVAK